MQVTIGRQVASAFEAPLVGSFSARASFIIRAFWLVYITALYGLAFAGTVMDFPQRLILCESASCPPGRLTLEGLQRLQASGLSLEFYAIYTTFAPMLVPLVALPLSTLLVLRRPNERMALMFAFVIGSCAAFTTGGLSAIAMAYPSLQSFLHIVNYLVLAGFPALFFLFPNGHWIPRWTRWVALATCILLFVTLFPVIFPPDSLLMQVVRYWSSAVWLVMFGVQVYRYRTTTDQVQRQQIKWIASGVGVIAILVLVLVPLNALVPRSAIAGSPVDILVGLFGSIGIAACLSCIGIAVLRYRLFEIDLIINRALVYGLLSGCVVGMYALIASTLGTVLNGNGGFAVSLAATALVAMLFQPLREGSQRAVNRLLYGERDEPYRVIARLGNRLEAAFEPAAVLPAIVQTVSESLKLPYVAIALAEQGQMKIVASAGTPGKETLQVPLAYQGAPVGQLHVSPRRGESHLSPSDQRLIIDLAQQAGVAAHGVHVMAELRQVSQELQRSREQLVLAREEERRRLRRDLHDDLAPTLAGFSLTALTIGELIQTEPEKASTLSNELHVAMRGAIGNIRRLVYDLRPSALDDLGLLGAIRERAAQYSTRALQVSVIAPDRLPPLPAAVEVATFRIAQEGLMNVVKHAQAKSCRVTLAITVPPPGLMALSRVAERALHFEICDDGVGLAPKHSEGVGLRSMQERTAELGGRFVVDRMPAGGTRITIDLPLPTEIPYA